MSNEKDGGPAFPGKYRKIVGYKPAVPTRTYFSGTVDGEPIYEESESGGMSLRDYFAGQALTGLLANAELEKSVKLIEDEININIEISSYYPKIAYQLSDAMLKEREDEN